MRSKFATIFMRELTETLMARQKINEMMDNIIIVTARDNLNDETANIFDELEEKICQISDELPNASLDALNKVKAGLGRILALLQIHSGNLDNNTIDDISEILYEEFNLEPDLSPSISPRT